MFRSLMVTWSGRHFSLSTDGDDRRVLWICAAVSRRISACDVCQYFEITRRETLSLKPVHADTARRKNRFAPKDRERVLGRGGDFEGRSGLEFDHHCARPGRIRISTHALAERRGMDAPPCKLEFNSQPGRRMDSLAEVTICMTGTKSSGGLS